jgi:hypothetical protein
LRYNLTAVYLLSALTPNIEHYSWEALYDQHS